jgi:hypothetical protein
MPPDDRCCQPDVRPATLSVQTPCPPSTRCSLVADRPPVTCRQCHSTHLHAHVELAPTTEVNFGVEVHPPVATFDQPGPGQDLYETSVRVQESQIRFRSWIPLTALVLTTLMSTPAEAMVRLVGTDCTQPGSAAAASCQTPATSASSNPTSGDAAPPPDTPNTRSPAAQPPSRRSVRSGFRRTSTCQRAVNSTTSDRFARCFRSKPLACSCAVVGKCRTAARIH